MCGIAGILGRIDSTTTSALRRMAEAMSHRGPDGEGFWESSSDEAGRGCLLAHRRLSILDLTDAASQPMTDPVTGDTVCFNGEIYNYRLVRSELEAAGEHFASTGDTAVLLRLVGMRGPEAIARMRGMFAFALWDHRRRELLLARDPLGIKPLYFARNQDANGAWSLVFASELRAILASGLISQPRLDPDAVCNYVWNGFVPGPGTIIRGIESLRPGEYRVYSSHGEEIRRKRYWTVPAASDERESDEERVRDWLKESCALHMISDVPIGVFLSSGVDSSAVANLCRRISDRPLNTFTLTFDDPEYDEGPMARKIAEAIGTDHHEIPLTESDFVSNLDHAIQVLDQPTFDALNTYYVSWAVRQAGMKVALAGTGGDEHFGGYSSFRSLPKLLTGARRTRWLPDRVRSRAARAVSSVLTRQATRSAETVPAQTRWAKLPAMVGCGDDLISLYQLAYALFLPDFRSELLVKSLRGGASPDGLPTSLRQDLDHELDAHSPLEKISILEYRNFQGERLLRDSDVASMAVSLELRIPLVDQELTQRFSRLDEQTRYQPVGSKRLLRRVGLDGLDPALFDRPKRGFVLPFDRWIRRNLFHSMDETLRDQNLAESVGLDGPTITRLWTSFQANAPGLYWSRVWSLYVLLDWSRRQGVTL
jgi:asparagine synthase (glutamine-hydrolysing)